MTVIISMVGISICTRGGKRHVTFGPTYIYAHTCTHACVRPTYQAECHAGLFRVKTFTGLTGESQGNISFGASRKIRARPVVIAPSWATALFAQTTAEPLNGGPGLSQKPERTTGGEERRSIGLPVFVCVCGSVCMCLSQCVSV